jgi:Fe-S oxidoreductase
MKIEFLWHRQRRHGLRLKDRMVASLPRLAPWLWRFRYLLALRDRLPFVAGWTERLTGLSARRRLPAFHPEPFRAPPDAVLPASDGPEVALLLDTFTTWFEPENARAAHRVLERAGYRVSFPVSPSDRRPLCCGRTFLSAGLVEEARAEARRLLDAVRSFVERGVPLVGLEPSCLLTLRDELPAMLPGAEAVRTAQSALGFEEFLGRERATGRLQLRMHPLAQTRAVLHGHCHQKAFGLVGTVTAALQMVPGLEVETLGGSCCGMAGTFGYEAAHHDVSMQMAERTLLPAVRRAPADVLLVADGFSCQHQILGGTGRTALHVARVLDAASG